tara:strand:- start:4705 stop:5934 length:1230 start_codon:yes stop_codon:yes gene_type:complete
LISELEKKIVLRYLNPKRKEGFLKIISIFSFLGIAIGVSVLIIVMSVMNGFRTELTNKILGFNPHITIKPYDQPINQIKKNELDFPNLSSVFFSLNEQAILIDNNFTKGILIRGYKKKDILEIGLIKNGIVEGSLDNFNKNSISVGKELAIELNLAIGDRVSIMSPNGISTIIGNIPKQSTYTVSSIYTSGLADFDEAVIFMTLKDVQYLFNRNNDDLFLEIYLNNPNEFIKAQTEIEKSFSNVLIYSWADSNKSFFSALKVERNVMFIILSLIVIVAAFNIISGLTILVKNKTRDIAILRSLGVTKKSIKKIFFLVGFSIGSLATLTGVFFGILFSLYIENVQIFLSEVFNLKLFPEEIYFLSQMPSQIDPPSIIIISISSIIITTIVSIYPSDQASKLDPIHSIKYE